MPAPVVYVLAIVGTVGAVLAFKEFVYEPHIAPAIDRWKLEYQAAREARRRRRAMEVAQDGSDLLMTETRKKSKSKSRPSDKYSDSDSDDSDDEDHGKSSATSHSFMRDGLLLRRPTLATKNQLDVELEDLVAHEVSQWRSSQVLRHRKNVSEHAMDEPIQSIPFAPLSPSAVFDISAVSPSPPSPHIQLPPSPPPSLPPQSPPAPPTGVAPTDPVIVSESPLQANVPQESANPSASATESVSSLHSPVVSPSLPATSSPSPEAMPFQQMAATQSTLLGSASPSNIPSTTPASPQSYHQIIPSLSQSYPQDLDYEHDLELLSPPSSRADSPFSLAALSPNQGITSRPLSSLSSVTGISSPSSLRMGLGNQSYDAISPIPQIQLITPHDNNTSTVNSGRSSAYLSFADDSSEDGSDNGRGAQPYANLGTGISGEGVASAHAQSQYQYPYRPAVPLPPSLMRGPYNPSTPPEGQALGLFPIPPREPRTPMSASPPSHTVNASVAVGAGARDPSYFRASASASASASQSLSTSTSASTSAFASASASPAITSSSYLTAYDVASASSAAATAGGHGHAVHARQHSDTASELSDLDFMSDYQPSAPPSELGSEVSDLGEVSDGSWSMASADGEGAWAEDVERGAPGGRSWRA